MEDVEAMAQAGLGETQQSAEYIFGKVKAPDNRA
jgi:hypothetical protein